MSKPFENIWILSIALILGFLLWFHVATDKTYNYRLALPIVVVELGDRLTLADSPADSVTALVSATGKQLLRRQWRHRGVRILAAHLPVGRHAFGLTPSNTLLVDPGNDIVISEIIAPKSVQLNVDQIGKAQVKVIPNIEAVAADGYVVRPVYEPDPPYTVLRTSELASKELLELEQLGRAVESMTHLESVFRLRRDVGLDLRAVAGRWLANPDAQVARPFEDPAARGALLRAVTDQLTDSGALAFYRPMLARELGAG